MKFNRIVNSALAAATSLALGFGTIACDRDFTVAFVYSTSASNGTVSAYGVDYQSGELTQLNGSPFASQFVDPVTVIAHPNGRYIYVISGGRENAVEPYAVGSDGKLYSEATVNISSGASYPTAAAIDSTGSYLYVTFTLQSGYSTASPGPGGITIFPIHSDGTLGTPVSHGALNYVPVGNKPVAIAVAAPTCATTPIIATNTKCSTGTVNSFVYVVDQEASPNAAIIGFAQNTSTGDLTLLSGSACTTGTPTVPNVCTGYHAGVTPSAIAIEPTGRFVYVTDKTSNQVIGYQIATTTTGALTPLVSSPYSSGLYPVSITVDPRGKYVYTANYNSNTVSAYSIDSASGALGGAASVGNFTTSTGPTCVTIDPALGIYLYTSNYLDASVSGGQLSPNTGGLSAIANTPFPSQSLPSCVVSVPNGSHSESLVNP
jgi:6-phosphogluconolactonase (cycloisomerase 2 family)